MPVAVLERSGGLVTDCMLEVMNTSTHVADHVVTAAEI